MQHTSASFFPCYRKLAVCPQSARTARKQNALFFVIQIQHSASLQHGQIDFSCTVHADLFPYGQNGLQPRMRNLFGIQQRQYISDRNSIITAEACSLRKNEIIVHVKAQRFFLHIDSAVRRLNGYHVHMSLQYERLFRFLSGNCLFDNDNILPFILYTKKSPLIGKLFQVIADCRFVTGTVRYFTDFFKKVKYRYRFQSF